MSSLLANVPEVMTILTPHSCVWPHIRGGMVNSVSLEIWNALAQALLFFSPTSVEVAWFRSHSSNPSSCISKSITVSEVILQYFFHKRPCQAEAGEGHGHHHSVLTIQNCLFAPTQWGSDPRQQHQHQPGLAGSRRRQCP